MNRDRQNTETKCDKYTKPYANQNDKQIDKQNVNTNQNNCLRLKKLDKIKQTNQREKQNMADIQNPKIYKAGQ